MYADGWTTTDLIFKWKQADPVQVTSELHLPRFALEQFKTDYCDSQTNTGEKNIHVAFRLSFWRILYHSRTEWFDKWMKELEFLQSSYSTTRILLLLLLLLTPAKFLINVLFLRLCRSCKIMV